MMPGYENDWAVDGFHAEARNYFKAGYGPHVDVGYQQIDGRVGGDYHATPEELAAIDEADRSGVASADEVEAAFRTFRSA